MRKLFFMVTVVSVCFFLPFQIQAVQPPSYDAIVDGSGDPDTDASNVQTAVNAGGAVLLRGNFNFGIGMGAKRVMILNDVEIYGEADNQGNPMTVINGGFMTFFSPLTASPPSDPGPKIVIKYIHFDNARYTPINIQYTSGTDISENKITNVIPLPIGPLPGIPLAFVQRGANIGTYPNLQPGAVTGDIIISRNYVDLQNGNPEATMGQGVFVTLTWGADIDITDNVVVNASRNALESLENYRDENGNGTLTFRNNTITTPDAGIPFPGDSTPNGIVAGWFLNPSGATDPTVYSPISIEHNYIEQGGANKCFAIAVISSYASIRHNHIIVGGGEEAKGIFLVGPNGTVANNRIEGSGQYGLLVTLNPVVPSYENRLFGNNFNHFDPNEIGFDVGFASGSNYNELRGGKGTVEDLGIGNVIQGNWEIYP
jgi:hypothetical protein